MNKKRIDLKKLLVGKTLYLNGKKFFNVDDALYIPRHNYWVFLYGRPCKSGDYNTYHILNDMELQLLVANGTLTWKDGKVLSIGKQENV